jgi:hypothetical protein
MIELLILATIVAIAVTIHIGRKEIKRIEENARISEDFAEFLKTGNDKPWRKGK